MDTTRNRTKKQGRLPLYWQCQLAGWGLVATYWAYIVYTRDHYSVFSTFLNYAIDVAIGISLTHLYKQFAVQANWIRLPLEKLLVRVVPSILLLSVIYVLISNVKWYFFWSTLMDPNVSFKEAIVYWNPILITALRLMSIWILAYHLYHYYQKEVNTAKENAQLSTLIKQTQLDNLSAQLNPHFLFNSLNSIKSLILENPDTARRGIDLLSDLLRSSLYEKDKGLNTLRSELDLVNDYIELEKLRFEERLSMDVSVDKSLEAVKVPTLSVQLLVENAIKHGIDKKVQGGRISLVIHKSDDEMHIQVSNPGKISGDAPGGGLGLKNLRDRLYLQFKDKASLTLKQLDQDRVQATIRLPLSTDENN
ncbi:sensor histidine kinase [Robertkochia sediminum]|uniref:sensor histidine kinase n=1 Tax=Robertkochia sediminum TaxID=2785326 RepID=UPI001932391C|nr:histidine kinase [Robertkochia sediminum]MBL7472914.1 histidine kinase [Robertkochia sediminum]